MTAGVELVFAAVGVADVAIRTGSQVYDFLKAISDAPAEIADLRETVGEINKLAEASKDCLIRLSDRTSNVHTAVESLNAALKGLNRELRSLELLSSKTKGADTKWSRVKYVLDKRKISRSIESLERSKTLLAGALVVASGELSVIDHGDTLSIIRRCSNKLESKTDRMTRTISNTLHEHHQEAVKRHDDHIKTTSTMKKTQAQLLSRQAQISRALKESHHKTLIEHQKTRAVLSKSFEDVITRRMAEISAPPSDQPTIKFSSGRDIYFFGERRDMIMAYLLLVKAQLEPLLSHSLPYPCDPMLARYSGWLQSEFEYLLASAAHEASGHSAASCTSLDRWYYSRNSSNLPKSTGNPSLEARSANADLRKSKKEMCVPLKAYQQPRSTQHTFMHTAPFGRLRVHLPSKNEQNSDSNETGFILTCGIGQAVHIISGRFFRHVVLGHGTRLCAQLNVFTLVESEEHYSQLFAEGTVEEVDVALRQGIISPYHVNREGRNMCLYWAAEYARKDLLGHFDTQGIGVANLKHDFSLVAGFFRKSILNDEKPKLEASVDFVLERVYDSSFFLTEMTMGMLLWDYYMQRPRSLIEPHLRRLESEGLLKIPISSLTANDASPWDWPSVFGILRPLVVEGSYVHTTGSLGRNPIQRTFGALVKENLEEPGNPQAVEETIAALIAVGVDIHHRDNDGVTPSMYARRHDHWEQWCRALERNGKSIEGVLREDDCEWLARDDWQDSWIRKHGSL